MDPNLVVAIACLALFALLSLSVPVAFSLMIAGLLGIALLGKSASPEAVIESLPYVQTAQFTWIVIPMFILMGTMVTSTGLVSALFDSANKYLSRLPGGVGVAGIAACAGFSAVSGSSVATAAAIAPVAVREMIRAGYRPSFAAGVVASGGTLGVLIPPSIVLVLYGIVAGEPIGSLLVAGVVPGIISVVVMASTIMLLFKFRPQTVLVAATSTRARQPATNILEEIGAGYYAGSSALRQKSRVERKHSDSAAPFADGKLDKGPTTGSIGAIVRIAILFGVVIGGIYLGIVTTTEAAALGALAAVLIAMYDARRLGFRPALSNVIQGFKASASQTGMLFFIVIGSSIFTYFFVLAGTPNAVSNWIMGLGLSPIMVVIVILLAMIPLGMFLESFSMILIVVPIAYPIIVGELGFDGIWFGILMVKMIEVSLITPPVGLNVFVVSGVLKGVVTTLQTFKGVMWFIVADLILIAIFLLFPELITFWIPSGLA